MSSKTNILVVDDEEGMRETLGDVLEDKGYNVVLVEDGYKAIQRIKQTPFSIIFMDVKMPGIDGVETFREIKKISPGTSVIMMTAYAGEDLVKEAMEEGAYAVIYKPFEVKGVIDIIQEVLKRTLILIVDDRLEDREVLKDVLEDKGYEVTTVKDGYGAIKAVKEKHFNIIFMDVKMPGIDGVETFEEIKKVNPEVAVVMMTGYSVEDMIKKSLNKGAYTVIYKPFDPAKLIKIVEEIRERK